MTNDVYELRTKHLLEDSVKTLGEFIIVAKECELHEFVVGAVEKGLIEMVLDSQISKNRIMGRRLCVNDNNHPNNIYIEAIKPDGDQCRICGGDLKTRSDDQDEDAIDKRHNIYYDLEAGTMAAVNFYKDLSTRNNGMPKIIELDGRPGVKEVSADLLDKLK